MLEKPRLKHKMILILAEQKPVTPKDLAEKYNITYKTARLDLLSLEGKGRLKRIGKELKFTCA